MRRVAHWCVTHRLAVIATWLVVLFATVFIQSSTGSNYSSGNRLSGTQSATARDLLKQASPGAAGDSARPSERGRRRAGPKQTTRCLCRDAGRWGSRRR